MMDAARIKARTIVLGLELDGVHYPSNEGLLVSRMGPLAFLGFLELHAGLFPRLHSHGERIAALMAVMRENETAFPSFLDSWRCAPLATAKELLGWIDAWYLHGWTGAGSRAERDADRGRLAELFALEAKTRDRIGQGVGQRLEAVAAAMRSGVAIPVGLVELVDDIEDWPKAWRSVLALLPHRVRAWKAFTLDDIPSDRVRLLVCDSGVSATRRLAEFAKGADSNGLCAIFGGEGNLYDAIAAASGIPQSGTRASAGAIPASQTLPLALSLHKDPCDLAAMLAFLSHPVCPMAGIQHCFADAIAESGGIRNDDWEEARKRAEELWIKWKKDTAGLDAFIESWLPSSREPEDRFSRARAIEVANRVLAYLRSLDDKRSGSAVAEATHFVNALESLGDGYDELPWSVLSDLLGITGSAGNDHPLDREEAHALMALSSAGALVDPVETLVWFMPAPAPRNDPWPWAKDEIAVLRANGCELADIGRINSRPLRTMLRACSLARGSIVVMVKSIRGALSPIELALASRNNGASVAYLALEAELLAGSNGANHTVAEKRLPAVKRRWKCAVSLGPEEGWKSSYTQFDTFINRPAQWVLDKKALLRNGTILSLPDDSRRRGTCAHRLVETLFAEKGDAALALSDEDLVKWFEGAFAATLGKYGYSYLEPGAARERIHFKNELLQSVRSLREILRAAGAKNVRLERELKGSCCGAKVTGYADLMFERDDGSAGLIDMKYSTWTQGYAEKIGTDTDIQLTLYCELYRTETEKIPEPAYWLFPARALIARNGAFFPGSTRVDSPHNHDARFKMIVNSVKWRRDQLKEGDVEVVCASGESLEADSGLSAPPEGCLPMADAWDAFDPYISLYGWEEEA